MFLSVFMWVCLALFAAAAVIWLLDMVGQVTIRSSAQRTLLNAALGTTLLGGMASFAVGAFFTPPAPANPTSSDPSPGATKTPAPLLSSSPAGPSQADPGSPRPPSEAPPQRSPTPDPSLSETVRSFLEANRLDRPAIDPQWSASYPQCAEQSRAAPLPKIEARACFRALDQFNSAVLRPYQDAYDAYVPRVAELSYSQPAGEVLDFLRAEAGGFTNGTHEIAVLYRSISAQLDGDFARLRGQAY